MLEWLDRLMILISMLAIVPFVVYGAAVNVFFYRSIGIMPFVRLLGRGLKIGFLVCFVGLCMLAVAQWFDAFSPFAVHILISGFGVAGWISAFDFRQYLAGHGRGVFIADVVAAIAFVYFLVTNFL